MTAQPISACVIAMNEADNIERCLRSLSFCDDVVLVDSHSTDDTRERAAALEAHLATCVSCREYRADAGKLDAVLEAAPATPDAPDWDRLHRRIRWTARQPHILLGVSVLACLLARSKGSASYWSCDEIALFSKITK